MRALRFARYGPPDVLRVEQMPEPTPAAGQAKVRVHAVALNPLDWKLRKGDLRLLPVLRGPPRGLGVDFCGEIVAVGGGAEARHVGERVFGSLLPFGRDGALADYLVAPFDRIMAAPQALDDAHAATLPIAGGTALQALTDEAHVRSGQRVLITGAAGGVGHFAVQIARHLGAYVVAVCGPANVEFVRALGADEVVDYTRDDFTRRGDRFDVVFDAAGASSFAASRRVLAADGRYVNTLGDARAFFRDGACRRRGAPDVAPALHRARAALRRRQGAAARRSRRRRRDPSARRAHDRARGGCGGAARDGNRPRPRQDRRAHGLTGPAQAFSGRQTAALQTDSGANRRMRTTNGKRL